MRDIRAHLVTILCGPERDAMYKHQMARFTTETTKALKPIFTETTVVDIGTVVARVVPIRIRYGYFLNPPLKTPPPAVVDDLTDLLCTYITRIDQYLAKSINNGTILSTYVAFMTQQLAKGYEIDDTVILPRIQLFHRHIPASLMYSKFESISSKNISAFSRSFRRACLMPDETVRHSMIIDQDDIPKSVREFYQ